ncbi:hypothetical protein AALO_G00249510 [Alosa alosa]|uniref:Secreted protein n=1 Tax=Alosa alosa TaxID=278164 RepID=A0AAV6FY15_9TELE|nr:hypothetical protein AALO_G00249510 [Alosa alosa]
MWFVCTLVMSPVPHRAGGAYGWTPARILLTRTWPGDGDRGTSESPARHASFSHTLSTYAPLGLETSMRPHDVIKERSWIDSGP